jgi:hypothetical protein
LSCFFSKKGAKNIKGDVNNLILANPYSLSFEAARYRKRAAGTDTSAKISLIALATSNKI